MTDDQSVLVRTLGHSNRDLETYLDILESVDIRRIVDVRSHPHSQRFPHFSRRNIEDSLAEIDVDYEHWPELGGRRSPDKKSPNTALSVGFQAVADHLNSEEGQNALDRLVRTIRNQNPGGTALMCAEKDPDRCHRKLIADHLTARGVRVRHVIDRRETRNHQLTSHARVNGREVTYPGLV